METLLIPAFGFEFEEYLHGPVCSLSGMTGGVYLMPSKDSPDRARFSSLVQHHRTLSSEVFAIGECVSDDKRDLGITMTGESYTVPFELILPFQVVSSLIPIAKGIDGEGSRRFAHVDSLVSTKCR